MEPAGWAAIAVAIIGMFGAITHDLIQRQKSKPQTWNGVERRMVETIAGQIADKTVLVHAGACPMREEVAGLRAEMNKGFTAIRDMMAEELGKVREMVINLHGKP